MTSEGLPFRLPEGDASRLGGNQIGLKEYNERIVLSLILEAGALSKAEIARITRLSPQTVTNLVNRLLEERLLRKKNVVRGRVGQPSTPIELDPDGALSVGVKIGRRSLDLIALSFDRQIVGRSRFGYDVLEKAVVFELIGPAYRRLVDALTPHQRARLVGIGVAGADGRSENGNCGHSKIPDKASPRAGAEIERPDRGGVGARRHQSRTTHACGLPRRDRVRARETGTGPWSTSIFPR